MAQPVAGAHAGRDKPEEDTDSVRPEHDVRAWGAEGRQGEFDAGLRRGPQGLKYRTRLHVKR